MFLLKFDEIVCFDFKQHGSSILQSWTLSSWTLKVFCYNCVKKDIKIQLKAKRIDKEKNKSNKFRYKDFLVFISQTW